MPPAEFWSQVDELIASSRIVVDRPTNSPHPRYAEFIYPVDYGYLEGTTTGDGDGIDVWLGTGPRHLVGLICTVDLWKRDMEVKLLLGCSTEEVHLICDFFTRLKLAYMVVLREAGPPPVPGRPR
jgi:inorganic pyrophosphatase